MTKSVPYYRVKNGRAYWQPTKKMQAMGFEPRALGPDGDEAVQEAQALNMECSALRRGMAMRGKASTTTPKKGCIYFLFADSMVKIGFSTTPTARALHLQTGMSAPLTAIIIFAGERHMEKKLHARFSMYRSHREWFRASEPIRRLVQRSIALGRLMLDSAEKLEQTGTISNFCQIGQLETTS